MATDKETVTPKRRVGLTTVQLSGEVVKKLKYQALNQDTTVKQIVMSLVDDYLRKLEKKNSPVNSKTL